MQIDAHREILDEIRREIGGLSERLQQLRAVEAYHAGKLGLSTETPAAPTPPAVNGKARSGSNRFKNVNQREAASIIIQENGKPMRAGDIARKMVEMGFPKPDKIGKLSNSLFTTMTRDEKRFVKVGTGMWDIVKSEGTDTERPSPSLFKSAN